MLKVSSLTALSTVLLLSGCQTLQSGDVSQSRTEKLQLESASIGHLTKKADVEVVLSDESSVLETRHHTGIEYLPYILKLPKLDDQRLIKAQVKVTLEGEELLHGEQTIIHNEINRISLEPSFDKSLANTYWLAENLSGRGIPHYLETTLSFTSDGRLRGFAGCNRFKGRYKSAATLLEFDKVVTTRTRCSNPVMVHEYRFLNDFRKVEYFKIEEGKLMLFSREQEKPLVFTATDIQSVKLSMKK